ncbi:glycosyltransferase family 2 protein [Novipirellula artificiosorum]|uniref:UDP-Glc:alpha-D-GlcNAc-diphosphoundecaprenol beta-1,3-glucosyltransferase WfgD n=1 Tax=Novipirellula artificiosorum TaxID=2528016 RepID=A0A5C6DMM8_9BACT|nr:glycosyltransferase family 2 protein [Novipirellula artificiosorum]TWU37415.1 UDP-Glc:alpha-D-GlcNAc-diphosphoundecaprenol beta-1,3-glucosyltransferase WfgD [Novipirellula artificiosorum]
MNDPIAYLQPPRPGLVSVVIPAYNRDHLIASTLETVRRQTYMNWELFVVEDASSGETERIVKAFGASVPNAVTYLRNTSNVGAAETRNVAFRLVRGQYVATLDSDDRWLPRHLETMLDVLDRTGRDIASANVTMVEDGTDRELGVWGPSTEEVANFPASMFCRGFLTPSATVMRREVLERVGPWSSDHEYCEDYEFYLRCASLGVSFAHVKEPTCLYRKCHSDASTAKLALVVEAVAYTIRQYIGSPALDPVTCRNYAFTVFLQASRIHRRSNPDQDVSADRFRGGQLLLEAWRLSPLRFWILLKGMSVLLDSSVKNVLRPKSDRKKYRTKIERLPNVMDGLSQRMKNAA